MEYVEPVFDVEKMKALIKNDAFMAHAWKMAKVKDDNYLRVMFNSYVMDDSAMTLAYNEPENEIVQKMWTSN